MVHLMSCGTAENLSNSVPVLDAKLSIDHALMIVKATLAGVIIFVSESISPKCSINLAI